MLPDLVALFQENTRTVLIVALSGGIFLLLCVGVALLLSLRFGARARWRRRVSVILEDRPQGSDNAEKLRRAQLKQRQKRLREIDAEYKKPRKRNVLRRDLEQAGLAVSVRNFLLLGAALAILTAVGALILKLGPIIAVLIAIAVGLGLPRLVIRHIARRRRDKFTAQFAGAVDVIVRGVRAGLPVDECFNIIARENPDPVAAEFRQITEGYRLGLTMEAALTKAYERVPTAEMKFFVVVLSIQKQVGGSLAETLNNLSQILRDRAKMAGKVRAMSSEAKASATIIGSLPIIMVGLLLVVNPDYMLTLFTHSTGHVLLGIAIVTMAVGTWIMKKMVSFEI